MEKYGIKNINILRIWKVTNKPNRIVYDNNYDYLVENFNKLGEENKYYDYLFLISNNQDLGSITQIILDNHHFNDTKTNKKDNFFMFSTHLDKSEEYKIKSFLKAKYEILNSASLNESDITKEISCFQKNKFFTVICKCINFDDLIYKSSKYYNEDISYENFEDNFKDIIEQFNHYNFDSEKSIFEILNMQKERKIYVLKNRAFFIPEYLIEYSYSFSNHKQQSDRLKMNINEKPLESDNSKSYKLNFIHNNILISSYSYMKEGKSSELKSDFIKNFNSSLKTLISSDIGQFVEKSYSNKNSSCNFQFFDELQSTDLYFAKNSIVNFLNHCYKYNNKDSFISDFLKINENLSEIKNVILSNPLVEIKNNKISLTSGNKNNEKSKQTLLIDIPDANKYSARKNFNILEKENGSVNIECYNKEIVEKKMKEISYKKDIKNISNSEASYFSDSSSIYKF